ncbi:MAG: GH36 C-terminal domain-containing protein, partial [Clostridia bacterium]|nr:GH36 C-terminal domain-containing protein [Clostridia bacterium]
IAREVKIYKDFIRPYICDSLVFHHTESTDAMKRGRTAVIELASKDGSRDAVGVFSAADSKETEVTVYPRGLDAGKTYRVTEDNGGGTYEAKGFELIREGLFVRIPSSMSSALILISEAE